MDAVTSPGIRRSIFDIQADYDTGKDKRPLELLMRAWKGIKELPPEDPHSFFMLGGYHGEPFRGPGITDPNWWGGYCQHGTVLFPTWHRAYLHRLEKALQSIPGCESVMLPFWDECSKQSQSEGIPKALTDPTFVLDGQTVPNPLRSFVLPDGIVDRVTGAANVYSKPAGYETVRYPLSGLVGTQADAAASKAHNMPYINDPGLAVSALNGNIKNWLTGKIDIDGNSSEPEIYQKFVNCLDAPTYTLFSNVTSASAWNEIHKAHLVPLESPHNDMHLAVGGFDYPNQGDFSPISGANGDMGENDTAGLDPIFYFHHCFIDYVFWIWQRRHGATNTFTIDPHDPGAAYWASANANNQPPAGASYGDVLGLHTPLDPFPKPDGTGKITTADCINIERQLGYTYGPGSLDAYAQSPIVAAMAASVQPTPPGHTIRVSGINRTRIRGSFLISAFATVDGKREYVGTRAVLSRWHLEGCMNCQSHLEAKAHFRLPARADAVRSGTMNTMRPVTAPPQVEVEIHTHDGLFGGGPQRPLQANSRALAAQPVPFKVEIL